MKGIFMNAKDVQEFLDVSSTTAYQIINDINQYLLYNKTWYGRFYYTNWKGEKFTKKKRGFSTKKEVLKWEKNF